MRLLSNSPPLLNPCCPIRNAAPRPARPKPAVKNGLLVSCWKIEPSPLPPSVSDLRACSFDGTAGVPLAGGTVFSACCCSIEKNHCGRAEPGAKSWRRKTRARSGLVSVVGRTSWAAKPRRQLLQCLLATHACFEHQFEWYMRKKPFPNRQTGDRRTLSLARCVRLPLPALVKARKFSQFPRRSTVDKVRICRASGYKKDH